MEQKFINILKTETYYKREINYKSRNNNNNNDDDDDDDNNNNNNNNNNCRVTICGPSPKCMESWSNEPNTMNL